MTCNLHLSEQLVRFVLKVKMQDERGFMEVILLYVMYILSYT